MHVALACMFIWSSICLFVEQVGREALELNQRRTEQYSVSCRATWTLIQQW